MGEAAPGEAPHAGGEVEAVRPPSAPAARQRGLFQRLCTQKPKDSSQSRKSSGQRKPWRGKLSSVDGGMIS